MNRQRIRIRRSFAVTAISVVSVVLGLVPDTYCVFAIDNQVTKRELGVDGSRPLAAAVKLLEQRHALVITYEDPPYVHESDIADVTLEVRRDLDEFPSGNAPKVLIPRPGRIEADYMVSAATGQPVDVRSTIQGLLDVHRSAGNPGIFRWIQTGDLYHVLPLAVKNSDGKVVPQDSVLDTKISLAEKERTGIEILQAVSEAISAAPNKNVVVGTVPVTLLAHHRVSIGASDETARDVLVRAIAGTGRTLSWQLFYDPRFKQHVLNLHAVQTFNPRDQSWRDQR